MAPSVLGLPTSRRTVALLDILGFRELIKTTPLDELSQRFDIAIANADHLSRPLPLSPDGEAEAVRFFLNIR